MANVGAQLDNKQEIQQINYGDVVNFAINVRTRVLNLMDTSPRLFDGSEIRENIGYAMPAGGVSQGPSGTGATVPPASTSLNAETFMYQTYHYDTISIDWDAADQTSGRHSYISAVKQELIRVAQFRPREMERQIMSDGSGYMALILTVTTDDATSLIFTVTNANAVKFLVNTPLNFWNWDANTAASDAALIATGGTGDATPPIVTNVSNNFATNVSTITCSAGGTNGNVDTAVTTNGDTVYASRWKSITEANGPTNGTNLTNTSNEMNGLDILISDQNEVLVKNTASGSGFANFDTFQNIARTNNSWFQSSSYDAGGSKLSASLVDRVANQIATWGAMSPDEVEYIVSSYDSITDALQGQYPGERYPHTNNAGALDFSSGSTTTFDVSYGPTIGERMTVKSEFTASNKAYLMGPGMLHYDLKPWGFWTGSGSMWRLPTTGRPAQEAHAYCIKAVGATKPNSSGVITNLG